MKKLKPLREREPGPRREKKPINFRRILLLLLILAVTAGSYYLACRRFAYAFLFYYGLAILLGFGYVIINNIPCDDEKRAERKENTKWILMILVPLLLVIGVDVIILFFSETYGSIFS